MASSYDIILALALVLSIIGLVVLSFGLIIVTNNFRVATTYPCITKLSKLINCILTTAFLIIGRPLSKDRNIVCAMLVTLKSSL